MAYTRKYSQAQLNALYVVTGHKALGSMYKGWSANTNKSDEDRAAYRRWIALSGLLARNIDIETGMKKGVVHIKLSKRQLAQIVSENTATTTTIFTINGDLNDIKWDLQTLVGLGEFKDYAFQKTA